MTLLLKNNNTTHWYENTTDTIMAAHKHTDTAVKTITALTRYKNDVKRQNSRATIFKT